MIAACVERVTGTMHERLDSMGAENSLKQQPQPHIEKSYGRHLPPGTVILRPAGGTVGPAASYRNAVLFSLI